MLRFLALSVGQAAARAITSARRFTSLVLGANRMHGDMSALAGPAHGSRLLNAYECFEHF